METITKAIFCALLVQSGICFDIQHTDNDNEEKSEDATRGRRDVIEEEKFYNIRTENRQDTMSQHTPWLPGPLPPEDPTTKISITNTGQEIPQVYQTTESITDKPTGRGARASNENWIKLPFPNRDDGHDILTPPQPSGELINSRMPRVNFVTQNKAIEASESRNDKESIQRPTRTDDLRTEFVRPEEDTPQYKPVYPRQAVYYPEDNRRPYYDDRYYPADDLYKRDPYYDLYDRKRHNPGYGPRVDRYDEAYDNYVPRKPKRIIYYAHLPEVVRTPPSVDLRYRYSVDPYRRFDDDYSARSSRYDYRFRPRYPYAPLRKDDRRYGYKDLASSSTSNKDKKIDEKVTPTPILPKKEDFKSSGSPNRNTHRNTINSHQYHDTADNYNDLSHKSFLEQKNDYLRFDEPLFHSAIEDPYQRKY
ncbi:uncharacterized protein LOC123874671 [Maniola jurtina]|uniref:uncharacterized protein LOC123874671 n=1 Tax=Maniola jurtina TaxID=191418 RepID=UPI001E68FBF9|nr:uncharacterized protein LOC123874671 [Maniola jurtina]XP_045776131.1 uncharacterized protein LOC123874671 [Maniola jurtina]